MPKRDGTLTVKEQQFLDRFQRLADRWPAGLTLLSAAGNLVVVPTKDYLNDTLHEERSRPIFGVPNDGGDPTWSPLPDDERGWDE